MIKAARKATANAGLARAFADISECPHYEQEAMHSFNYTWYVAPAHGHKYENPEITRILILPIINAKR